jgi:hypothetical protein
VAGSGAGAGCGGKMWASQETEMNRLGQTWLVLSFSAAAVLPAHAQVTVEMTKITCEQYIPFDLQEFHEASKKVMDYCQANLKTPVMDAAEKVLGVKR